MPQARSRHPPIHRPRTGAAHEARARRRAQVKKTEAELKQKADQARKAAAAAAFATAFSMLIGAFIAGAAGALGDRHRDEQPVPLARTTL
jgi:hypothetical protein